MEPNPLYARSAFAYVRHADTSAYNAGYERPAMLAAVGDVTGLTVLDAGCAGGFYAAAFSSASHVIAIDLSEEMIALVRGRDLANVEARVHDLAEPLAWLAQRSVDLVVSSLALHYVADWSVPLGDFARVLRPGGRLVFSVHHPAMTAPLVSDYFETQAVREMWSVGDERCEVRFMHRSLESIVAAVLAAGFSLTRLIEPHLDPALARNDDERKLATRPWFIIFEARVPS